MITINGSYIYNTKCVVYDIAIPTLEILVGAAEIPAVLSIASRGCIGCGPRPCRRPEGEWSRDRVEIALGKSPSFMGKPWENHGKMEVYPLVSSNMAGWKILSEWRFY